MGRRVSRRAFAALAATLLLLSWCSGCKRSPELEPVVDLVQAFPAAELSAERAVVDFGTSEGGSFLASGWSWREKSRDQTTFVWSSGRQSVLEFFVAEPRDLQVRMRCLAYPFKGGAPQRLAIAVGWRSPAASDSSSWRQNRRARVVRRLARVHLLHSISSACGRSQSDDLRLLADRRRKWGGEGRAPAWCCLRLAAFRSAARYFIPRLRRARTSCPGCWVTTRLLLRGSCRSAVCGRGSGL
jgi:hypothetical protein